jgi:hypothetical protein
MDFKWGNVSKLGKKIGAWVSCETDQTPLKQLLKIQFVLKITNQKQIVNILSQKPHIFS